MLYNTHKKKQFSCNSINRKVVPVQCQPWITVYQTASYHNTENQHFNIRRLEKLESQQNGNLCITIRITNRYDFLYYVFVSFFSSFPYMFRAFMGPSSGVFQAVVFMLPFGSCSALLVVCVRQRTGFWW